MSEQDKHEMFAYHLVEAEYDAGAFAYVNRKDFHK